LAAIDPEEGLRLAAGKADLADDLLQMLLQGLPEDHQAIRQALEQEQQDVLLDRVHKLHGASRYCGVPELRECCQQAETLLKKGQDSRSAIIALLAAIDRLLETSAD